MFEGSRFEYIVKQKCEGKFLAKNILIVLGYIALALLLAVLTIALCPQELLIPIMIVAITVVVTVIIFTKKFFTVEYEYEISSGNIEFVTIYGQTSRRHTLSVDLKAFSEIGIYDDDASERMSRVTVNRNYIYISSLSSPNIYYALFDDGEDKCILYFEAPDEAVSLIKKYNPSAINNARRSSAQNQRKDTSK